MQPSENLIEIKPTKLVSGSAGISPSSSDLGLLAWLATSPSYGDRAHVDLTESTLDFSAASSDEQRDSLDTAFELLEGSALAGVAI